MIILFSPYLPSHDQDDYALCWVFKKNTICMCTMALLEGACHQLLTSGSIEYQTPEERRPPHVWPWPAENEAFDLLKDAAAEKILLITIFCFLFLR